MRKLIKGIVDFRQKRQPDYRETFRRLALEQKPDCLFIACSDSRVVPNLFASTEPGDLFVTRNVGNLVPPAGPGGFSTGDEAEAASIEYAIQALGVSDVVVCGHSSCGAMRAIVDSAAGRPPLSAGAAPNLARWLRHGLPALEKLEGGARLEGDFAQLPAHDALGQLNVLEQVAHVLSYPSVAERVAEGSLGLHGWWFDIASADVYAYEEGQRQFVLIDEAEGERLLARIHVSGD
ncbi:MAG TPA: carbonic anhydrase [Chloroflexota bacterium]|nr:carbonic anhydrase [Chloroflexota bacterium]